MDMGEANEEADDVYNSILGEIGLDVDNSTKIGAGKLPQKKAAVQEEAKELFKRKNATYGDAFASYGTVGVLVRMGDKIRRLQQIDNSGINLVDDESLRDTLIDLHNYSAMAIMLLDEDKNKYKEKSEFQSPSPKRPPPPPPSPRQKFNNQTNINNM